MPYSARTIAVSGSLALLVAFAMSTAALAQSNFTVIHSFGGGSDGSSPGTALVIDISGALYGTTPLGGALNFGTAFKLKPPRLGGAWTESVLHSFMGQSDGAFPEASLLLDASGNLYGTTQNGALQARALHSSLRGGQPNSGLRRSFIHLEPRWTTPFRPKPLSSWTSPALFTAPASVAILALARLSDLPTKAVYGQRPRFTALISSMATSLTTC